MVPSRAMLALCMCLSVEGCCWVTGCCGISEVTQPILDGPYTGTIQSTAETGFPHEGGSAFMLRVDRSLGRVEVRYRKVGVTFVEIWRIESSSFVLLQKR